MVCDRRGRILAEPIPIILLARVLTETNWQRLIGPKGRVWAYLNRARRYLHAREYVEGFEESHDNILSMEDFGQELGFGELEMALGVSVLPDFETRFDLEKGAPRRTPLSAGRRAGA